MLIIQVGIGELTYKCYIVCPSCFLDVEVLNIGSLLEWHSANCSEIYFKS